MVRLGLVGYTGGGALVPMKRTYRFLSYGAYHLRTFRIISWLRNIVFENILILLLLLFILHWDRSSDERAMNMTVSSGLRRTIEVFKWAAARQFFVTVFERF